MLLALLIWLAGGKPVPPTAEQIAAHEEWEDRSTSYCPSPMEQYLDERDFFEKQLAEGYLRLALWQLATAKVPFSRRPYHKGGPRFILPRRVQRKLNPFSGSALLKARRA